jgi:hypothetical protein
MPDGRAFRAELAELTMRPQPFLGYGATEDEARAVVAMALQSFASGEAERAEAAGRLPVHGMPRNYSGPQQDSTPVPATGGPPDAPEPGPDTPWNHHRTFRAGAWEACACELGRDHGAIPDNVDRRR